MIEAFFLRLRGLTELVANIHSEVTMKPQRIQGLPDFLRTDAYVYHFPKRPYQQVVTIAAGKYKAAATDMIDMVQSQASLSRGFLTRSSRRPGDLKPRKAPDPALLLIMDSRGPATVLQRPVDKDGKEIDPSKTYDFRAPANQYPRARTLDSRRPL